MRTAAFVLGVRLFHDCYRNSPGVKRVKNHLSVCKTPGFRIISTVQYITLGLGPGVSSACRQGSDDVRRSVLCTNRCTGVIICSSAVEHSTTLFSYRVLLGEKGFVFAARFCCLSQLRKLEGQMGRRNLQQCRRIDRHSSDE